MDQIRLGLPSARYSDHCLEQLIERKIDPAWVTEALGSPEADVIQHWPDLRGDKYLVLGWWDDGQPLHIVVGLSSPNRIITVWDPRADPLSRWESDYKTRKTSP